MYLEYYSLDRSPFRITPDPSLFYTGGESGRGVVLEALLYAVTSGEGILKVVGEVGSGKTMLCRMLEQRLPDTVEVVYLANPNLSPHDILYAIAFELKLPVDHSTQRLVLMQRLQEYLLKQHSENKTVLVIIEEAQSMPIETLEEIRLFSNLETHQHKLMQIILFGQPELDKNLQDKSIRQLRERITHSFDLRPLSAAEVSDYIRFRLHAAGCPAPNVFSNAAEKLIAKASGGLTRRINILADKAMLSAYAESATGKRPRTIDNLLQPAVQKRNVIAAMKDSGYKPSFWSFPKLALIAASIFVLIGEVSWWQLHTHALPQIREIVASNFTPKRIATIEILTPDASAAPNSTFPASTEVSAPNAESGMIVADMSSVPGLESVQDPIETTSSATVADFVLAMENEFVAAESAGVYTVSTVNPRMQPLIDPERLEARVSSTLRQPLLAISDLSPLLIERSVAMQDWLVETNPDTFTLQLISVSSSDSAYVTRVLTRLEQAGLIDRAYTCVSNTQGKDYWKVVFGEFATAAQARVFIEELPMSVLHNSPFAQSVRNLDCNVAMDLN